MDKLTVPQQILVAAQSLSQPFHESDLTIAVWERNKKLFGLRGFEDEYPDNNKLRANLMGKKGLVARGYFKRVAALTYHITEFGRKMIDRPADLRPIIATKADSEEITRMQQSKTFGYYLAGHRKSLTRKDAVAFWNGSPDGAEKVLGRIRMILQAMAEVPTGNGGFISSDLIGRLTDCNEYLKGKFNGV